MESWERSLDLWLTTPPEERETHFYCEGERCDEPFYPGDDFYEIEGYCLCRECALEWLDEQKKTATEGDCYEEQYGV